MNNIQLRNENKFRTPIHGRNFQGTTTCVGALYPEGNVQVYWTWKWFDFQIRVGFWKVLRIPLSVRNTVTFCLAFANKTFQNPRGFDGSCRSRYCGFQFQNLGQLIGMWDTREIITGLPYDFSHLITTHFAAFYKKHITTFVLSQKEREALGISEEEYIRANKVSVWGEKWKNQ